MAQTNTCAGTSLVNVSMPFQSKALSHCRLDLFLKSVETGSIYSADGFQRRVVIQFRRRIIIGITTIEGTAPFDLALAPIGREDRGSTLSMR